MGGDAAGHRTRTVVGGTERLVPLAGAGAPAVAEFAPAELGAALGMSTFAAGVLVGNALELRHRLPRLWGRVMAGQLPAWRAGKIAEHTKTLSAQAAAYVDAQLAPVAHRIGLGRVLALVEAAMKRFDPEAAHRQETRAAEARGVWVSGQMLHGTRAIHIEADALDAAAFDTTITDLADALAAYGDTDTLDVRRAKSIGTIADPQTALDLLSGQGWPGSDEGRQNTGSEHTGPENTDADGQPEDAHTGGPGSTTGKNGRSAKPWKAGRPQVALYVHLHQDAIEAGAGVGRVEGLGAATLAKIQDWVGRADLTITAVLDLDSRAAVDGHEVPDQIRETVYLRNPCCPFPWCPNLSRAKDDDHIEEYTPPTRAGNPGRPPRTSWPGCAGATTAARPTPAGPTRCPNPASTYGAHPKAAATWSTTPAPPTSTPADPRQGPVAGPAKHVPSAGSTRSAATPSCHRPADMTRRAHDPPT